MVDFTLTDEQKDLRELAHDFAEKEIRPVAWEYDKDGTWPAGRHREGLGGGPDEHPHPRGVRRPRASLPRRRLIEEELGWGCSGIGTSLGCNGLATAPVIARRLRGDQEEVPRHAHRGAQARLVLPHRARRRLRRLGHAHHAPSRRATSTSSTARSASSPTAATPTGTRSTPRPTRTPATAASPPSSCPRDDTASSSTRRRTRWASGRRTPRPSRSTTTEIPAENLLGEENKGFKLAMMTLDRTRPGVAAMAVGIARAAFEFATEYSKERVQFGVPIAMHQAIQFMIADMATKVARWRAWLTWQSAVAARPGQAQHARVLARQALRRRHRDGGHHRRRAGLRRLRLHQGLPGREADARREDHAALRGHVADPAPGASPARRCCRAASPTRRRRRRRSRPRRKSVACRPDSDSLGIGGRLSGGPYRLGR